MKKILIKPADAASLPERIEAAFAPADGEVAVGIAAQHTIEQMAEIASAAEEIAREGAEVVVRQLEQGSMLLECASIAAATEIAARLDEEGFTVRRAGDLVLARKELVRVPKLKNGGTDKPAAGAKPAAKTKLKAGGGAKGAPQGPAKAEREVEGDNHALRLSALHDAWAMNAMRKLYLKYVGTDNFSHYLTFIRAIDNLICMHRDLNGVEGEEGGESAEAAAENPHYDERRTRREIASGEGKIVYIPFDVLKGDVTLADVEIHIGAGEPATQPAEKAEKTGINPTAETVTIQPNAAAIVTDIVLPTLGGAVLTVDRHTVSPVDPAALTAAARPPLEAHTGSTVTLQNVTAAAYGVTIDATTEQK